MERVADQFNKLLLLFSVVCWNYKIVCYICTYNKETKTKAMTNIITSDNYIQNEELIDQETARKISAVPGAEHYGIMTCATINGEFVLCSDYDVPSDIESLLINA